MDPTVEKVALAAQSEAVALRKAPVGYFILSALAGIYCTSPSSG